MKAMENDKNKVDATIDEVLESKRLKQVFPIVGSCAIGFVVGAILVGPIDGAFSPPWEGIIIIGSSIVSGILSFKVLKNIFSKRNIA